MPQYTQGTEPIETCMLSIILTSTDPGNDSSTVWSGVTFQSDGTPLLELRIQVKVDNGMPSLLITDVIYSDDDVRAYPSIVSVPDSQPKWVWESGTESNPSIGLSVPCNMYRFNPHMNYTIRMHWLTMSRIQGLILLQLPDVCRFQDLVYTVTIQRVQPSHDSLTGDIVIGPKTVRGQMELHEEINSSLVVNAVYSVSVDMDTMTGIISSMTTFSKQSIIVHNINT